MKIFLDDVREPEKHLLEVANRRGDDWLLSGEWVTCRTASEAIKLIEDGITDPVRRVTHVSFDHDLGPLEAGTGYDVAVWCEERVHREDLPRILWNVHSCNPIGAAKIRAAMTNADVVWHFQEKDRMIRELRAT